MSLSATYIRIASDASRVSEVLESIIGKFKNLASERGQHGLTGMALSVGASVGKQAVGTVQTAMSTITNQQVWDCCDPILAPTVESVRAQIQYALNPEQKRKPLLLASG